LPAASGSRNASCFPVRACPLYWLSFFMLFTLTRCNHYFKV
jgi:hypothetical protein